MLGTKQSETDEISNVAYIGEKSGFDEIRKVPQIGSNDEEIKIPDEKTKNGERQMEAANFLTLANENKHLAAPSVCCCCSKRYQLAMLISLGFFLSFGMRCNMGIAIMEFLRGNRQNEASDDEESSYSSASSSAIDWPPEIVGLVDSSFFWGYFLSLKPGGYLAAKYPANKIFGFALATSSLLNLFLPIATPLHYGLVVFIRILQGVFAGMMIPACFGIWGYWASPQENTRLVTISFCGSYAGAGAGFFFSNLLSQLTGWQAPFYVFGVLGIAWWFLWWALVYEKPAMNPSMSPEERAYIDKAINAPSATQDDTLNTPWKLMLSCASFWVIIASSFAWEWTFYIFLMHQKFFLDAFRLDVSAGGIFSALPYLTAAFVIPSGGWAADYLRLKFSRTTVRKIFNCSGFLLSAIFIIAVGYSNSSTVAYTCLMLAIGSSCFTFSGYFANHLDIAPRYASILMGISSATGNLALFICPAVSQIMTSNESIDEWQNLFLVTGCVQLVASVLYAIFASGEKQRWANAPLNESTSNSQQPAAMTQPAANAIVRA